MPRTFGDQPGTSGATRSITPRALVGARSRAVTNPASYARFIRRSFRVRLNYTTPPTAGTFFFVINGTNATTNTFTAPGQLQGDANAVRFRIQGVLDGLSGALAGWRVYVTGGPWPQVPYNIYFYNLRRDAVFPSFSVDTSGLTGGSGLSVELGEPIIAQGGESSRGYNNGLPLSRDGNPTTSTGTTLTTTPPPPWTIDGNFRLFTNTGAGAQSTGAFSTVALVGRTIDVRDENVLIVGYNPNGCNVACTMSMTSNAANFSGTNNDFSVIAIPGVFYTRIRTSQSNGAGWAVSNFNASALTGVSFANGSYTGGSHFDPAGVGRMYCEGLFRIGRGGGGRSTLSIIFDDHQTNILNLSGENVNGSIFNEYGIRFGVAGVQSWATAGTRNSGTNTEGATVLNIAGLQTLAANVEVEFLTHSNLHFRYETCVNPASVATTSSEQAVQWAFGATPTGTFTITVPGVGTTGAIPVAATPRDVATALNALSAGLVTRVDLGAGISSTALSSQTSFRIYFAAPQQIISATIAGNTVIAGNAFTPAEIAAAYVDNANWFISQGIPMRSDYWVAPQGSVGTAVWAAAASRGVRCVRAASPNQGQAWFPNEIWNAIKYQVPVRTLGSGSGVVDNANDIIQSIIEAAEIGASIQLMGHNIVTSSGGPTDILTTDLRLVFQWIQEHNGGLFDLLLPSEQLAYLESLVA